jgi:hypothetical protein
VRKKPYTTIGIKRVDCFRKCGRKASTQWQLCADHNLYHPLCTECDIKLNKLVLDFMDYPDKEKVMDEYTRKMKGQHA